ncbi:hypothetical protein HDU67_009506, partial [Dinochytrium kinnereticum]
MEIKTGEPSLVLTYCRASKSVVCQRPTGIQALWSADVLQHSYQKTFNSALADCGVEGYDAVLWGFVGLLFDVKSPRPFGGRRRTGYLEFREETGHILDFIVQRMADPSRFARVRRNSHNDIIQHVVNKFNSSLRLFQGGEFDELHVLANRSLERSRGSSDPERRGPTSTPVSPVSSNRSTPSLGSSTTTSPPPSPSLSHSSSDLSRVSRTKYIMSSRALTPSYDAVTGEYELGYYVPSGSPEEGTFTYDAEGLEFFRHSPSDGSVGPLSSQGDSLSPKTSGGAFVPSAAQFEGGESLVSHNLGLNSPPSPPPTWSYWQGYVRSATPSYDPVTKVITEHTWLPDGTYHPIPRATHTALPLPSRPAGVPALSSTSRKRKADPADELDWEGAKKVKLELEADVDDVCFLGCCGGDRTGRLPGFHELERYRLMNG